MFFKCVLAASFRLFLPNSLSTKLRSSDYFLSVCLFLLLLISPAHPILEAGIWADAPALTTFRGSLLPFPWACRAGHLIGMSFSPCSYETACWGSKRPSLLPLHPLPWVLGPTFLTPQHMSQNSASPHGFPASLENSTDTHTHLGKIKEFPWIKRGSRLFNSVSFE